MSASIERHVLRSDVNPKRFVVEYKLRADGNWIDLMLEPGARGESGTLTMQARSSYGDFSYHWGSVGRSPLAWFADISTSYLLSKIADEVYDGEATVEAARAFLKRVQVSDEERTVAFERLDDCKGDMEDQEGHAWAWWLSHCPSDGDYHGWGICKKMDPQAVGFERLLRKHLLPVIAVDAGVLQPKI